MSTDNDVLIVAFTSAAKWAAWLSKNHNKQPAVWLRFYKKASGKSTITYAEALDEALCYGWIDGQSKGLDEESYLQRFSPRRSKSVWSKINRLHIRRLQKAGKMKPAGLAAVAAAKADGRWQQAYDSPSTATAPADFLKELRKNPKAKAFYKTLNKTNTYAIIWRLQTAKKLATRQKRIQSIIAMLSAGKKFHA